MISQHVDSELQERDFWRFWLWFDEWTEWDFKFKQQSTIDTYCSSARAKSLLQSIFVRSRQATFVVASDFLTISVQWWDFSIKQQSTTLGDSPSPHTDTIDRLHQLNPTERWIQPMQLISCISWMVFCCCCAVCCVVAFLFFFAHFLMVNAQTGFFSLETDTHKDILICPCNL